MAFLTLGDPTIYSTYLYVHKLVINSGYDAIIIRVSHRFVRRRRRWAIPLRKQRNRCILFRILRLHEESLDLNGTKVLMKSGKSIGKVKECLDKRNLSDTSKMVQNCGMENECIYRTMNDVSYNPDYFSVIIVKENKKNLEERKNI